MRLHRREKKLGTLLLMVAWLVLPAPLMAADDNDSQTGQNWVERTLHRFFGNKALTGESIDGEGLEIVSPYVKHAGKTIEVVIIRQVKTFEESWDDDKAGSQRLFNKFSKKFQDYTQERILRQYLLFKAGDTIEPFDLADSERLLRNLPYINDVRIHVVPIDGAPDKVGIVVETNDRWPLGIAVTVITADRWRARLSSNNVGGLGLLFSNELLYNKEAERSWGYNGVLEKENLGGSFWKGKVEYESSYRKDLWAIGADRFLAHPGLKFVGGARWQDLDDFEQETPRAFKETDVWAGEAFKMYDHRTILSGSRTMLIPAIRFQQRNYYKRPTVSPDTNRGVHNFDRYFASLTLQHTKSYKTSYLFGEGEVEDLPTGVTLKVSGGVEHREFEHRPGLFFDSAAISMRNRGDVSSLRLSIGGFMKDDHFEDGILDIFGAYFTHLMGAKTVRHRLYFTTRYTLGIGRHPFDKIYLGDRSGIYRLDNGLVAGNQRLVFKALYRVFTHWSLLGFRLSFFTYADVGAIAHEDHSIFKQKFYLSTGVGVRMRNPGLVLPTFQFRVSLVTNVENPGFSFGLKLGNAPGPEIKYPGIKPGTVAYE